MFRQIRPSYPFQCTHAGICVSVLYKFSCCLHHVNMSGFALSNSTLYHKIRLVFPAPISELWNMNNIKDIKCLIVLMMSRFAICNFLYFQLTMSCLPLLVMQQTLRMLYLTLAMLTSKMCLEPSTKLSVKIKFCFEFSHIINVKTKINE